MSSQRSAAHGFDTGAWRTPRQPPSWLPAVRMGTVTVRPGAALPLLAFGAAAAVFALVAGYGIVEWDASWGVLAAILGLGGLALALVGYPLPAIAVLLGAIACWGFVARSLVPDSFGDLLGVAGLLGGNLAVAVPLAAGAICAFWADGRRTARARVAGVVVGQRWFGINRGEPEPQLPALEQLPAARFFALPSGRSSHLVVVGTRAALVATTVWPRGEYTVGDHEIHRNGRTYAPGTDDVDAVVDDLRTWAARLAPVGASSQAFLAVHPASGRMSDTVRLSVPLVEGVRVVAAAEFVDAVGEFLLPGGNSIDVAIMAELADLTGMNPDATG